MSKSDMLLLASNSPRRRELLAWAGWNFTTRPVNLPETFLEHQQPQDIVKDLAEQKASAALEFAAPGQVVVGADTLVVDEKDILGKPADADEAVTMLRRLRGHTHHVYTGIAVIVSGNQQILSDVCVCPVTMRMYSDDEIVAYVASGDPLDKAGAYAIQNREFQPVTGFASCYTGVMGLPLCHLNRILRSLGMGAVHEIAPICQTKLYYSCSIYPEIQREQHGSKLLH